jgi:hypothetical protein
MPVIEKMPEKDVIFVFAGLNAMYLAALAG